MCPFLLLRNFPQLGSEQKSLPVSCCQCFLVTISSVTTVPSTPYFPGRSPFLSKGSLFPSFWFRATTGGKLFALIIRFFNQDLSVSFWTSSTSRCISSRCRFSCRRVIMASLHMGQERVFSRSSSLPERENWSGDWEVPGCPKLGLRMGDLLLFRADDWRDGSIAPPNTRRARGGWGVAIFNGTTQPELFITSKSWEGGKAVQCLDFARNSPDKAKICSGN